MKRILICLIITLIAAATTFVACKKERYDDYFTIDVQNDLHVGGK